MKIFRAPDGRLLQLADLKKIKEWDAEMPLLFIGAIREKRLPIYRKEYPKAMVQEVENYLDEILEQVAIPKLINSLTSPKLEERLKVSENIFALSESNPDQLAIAIPHIEKAIKDPNKEVASLMDKSLKNYQKAQKRKQTVAKRKKLTELRKKMDDIDIKFAEGKINDAEYIREQKAYLKLKREIELEEEI